LNSVQNGRHVFSCVEACKTAVIEFLMHKINLQQNSLVVTGFLQWRSCERKYFTS